MEKLALNAKSKDGKHEWNRDTLCKLHESGMSDAQIADLFGTSDAFVSFGRKRESYWAGASALAQESPKPSEEVAEPSPKTPKKAVKISNEKE